MAKFRKFSPTTVPNILASQLLPQPHLMLIFFHCLATGASVNECLHFYNQTPTDWCSKKQATVETARYGSEFAAAKTATEQIMDLRYTLRYLDVPTSINPTCWRQQVCCYQCYTSSFNPEQEEQHPGILQGKGSHSCQNHIFSLDLV